MMDTNTLDYVDCENAMFECMVICYGNGILAYKEEILKRIGREITAIVFTAKETIL